MSKRSRTVWIAIKMNCKSLVGLWKSSAWVVASLIYGTILHLVLIIVSFLKFKTCPIIFEKSDWDLIWEADAWVSFCLIPCTHLAVIQKSSSTIRMGSGPWWSISCSFLLSWNLTSLTARWVATYLELCCDAIRRQCFCHFLSS